MDWRAIPEGFFLAVLVADLSQTGFVAGVYAGDEVQSSTAAGARRKLSNQEL